MSPFHLSTDQKTSLTSFRVTKWWPVHKWGTKELWEVDWTTLFCYFVRIPPQFVLCVVVQFRSKIPCCTKTKTHSHSQAGNPRPVHVYLSALEISSLSHSTRAERPSRASSSASDGIDPGVNARSPKERPRLSRAPHHICVHSASRSLETFCFYIWVHAQAQFVCIVYKKTPTENHRIYLGYRTNYYTQEKQILYFIIMCMEALIFRVCPALTSARKSSDAELPNLVVYVKIRKC